MVFFFFLCFIQNHRWARLTTTWGRIPSQILRFFAPMGGVHSKNLGKKSGGGVKNVNDRGVSPLFPPMFKILLLKHVSLFGIFQPFHPSPCCHNTEECFGNEKSGRDFVGTRNHKSRHAVLSGRCHRSVGGQGGKGGNVSYALRAMSFSLVVKTKILLPWCSERRSLTHSFLYAPISFSTSVLE